MQTLVLFNNMRFVGLIQKNHCECKQHISQLNECRSEHVVRGQVVPTYGIIYIYNAGYTSRLIINNNDIPKHMNSQCSTFHIVIYM